MISYTSGPTLGNFEAGALASVVGVRASVVSGGVMCVVGTGVILAFLPAFWRYDAREGGARDDASPLAHETWFESGAPRPRLELRGRDRDAAAAAPALPVYAAMLVLLGLRAPTASCAPASRRCGRGRGAQPRGGASGDAARGAKLRLRVPWNLPSGRRDRGAGGGTRGARAPEALARPAFLALPVSCDLERLGDRLAAGGLEGDLERVAAGLGLARELELVGAPCPAAIDFEPRAMTRPLRTSATLTLPGVSVVSVIGSLPLASLSLRGALTSKSPASPAPRRRASPPSVGRRRRSSRRRPRVEPPPPEPPPLRRPGPSVPPSAAAAGRRRRHGDDLRRPAGLPAASLVLTCTS